MDNMKKEAQKFLANCWANPTAMGLYEISLQNLIYFGEIVEQATLEMAAKELRSAIDDKDDVVTDLVGDVDPVAYRVINVMEKRIRALKDSND